MRLGGPQIFQHLNIANSWEETFAIILNYNHVAFLKGLQKIIKMSGQPPADCGFKCAERKARVLTKASWPDG
jgi:hypothetical protein